MRERKVVTGLRFAWPNDRKLILNTKVFITVKEQAVFFLVGFVENYEPSGNLGAIGRRNAKRTTDYLGKSGPLAQITSGIEIGHASGVIGYGVPFVVSDYQVSLFLINVSDEKILEESTKGIEIHGNFFRSDPLIPHAL